MVSSNVASPPEGTVTLGGAKLMPMAPTVCVAQLLAISTVAGRLWSPARIALGTEPGSETARRPPVPAAIAEAWPNALRLPTLIAITRMLAALSSAIAWASLTPPSSWLGASPNQTMTLDEPVRKPVAPVASEWSAKIACSGVSQPPDADHKPMPLCTSAVFPVICWSRRKANGSDGHSNLSLYSAAQNCASGWDALTEAMIAAAFACTFEIAPNMLPVVSARKQMSGCGGMIGVCTGLATVALSPGLSVNETDEGLNDWAKTGVQLPATATAASARAQTIVAFTRNVSFIVTPLERTVNWMTAKGSGHPVNSPFKR